ncbi:unnamed protein product [Leptidea sinapis]|uniref:ATP-dependent RNA helicase n=1 Tax=Leptidea sinapis TaxID=189913 RepID=A0A5E4R0X2_9NEOP|nr:unnamed protein product [Leptidea sinapis]
MEIDYLITNSNFLMLKGKVGDRILQSLEKMGFEKPTEIQAKVLPHMLYGADVIGAAKTGSGKTLAFLIPIVDCLLKHNVNKKFGVGCIIISPTRELALQTYKILRKLLENTDLTHRLIVGGVKKLKELKSLQKGVNIIVGTPGRLLDHLDNTKDFHCDNLKYLILDEADKLLEAGFEKHIARIIMHLPKDRQTGLFSATIDDKVKNLAKLALRRNPVLIAIKDEKQATVTGLKQGYFTCPLERRISWLYKMLKKAKKLKVIVFFSSCKSVDFHYEFFKVYCKAPVLHIHGKLSQARRKETFESFVEAACGVLFCTDIAARGLDIPSVDWVVQFDPPTDVKEYIHRVGRTARGLQNTGNAVILLRPEEECFVEFLKIEKVFLDKYTFETPTEASLARKAYLSYIRCYTKHKLKSVFNIENMDLALAAKAFGFLKQPDIDF